jgi:hypothetical protein
MLSHEEALSVQRREERWIMALPGVTGVAVKIHSGRPVLEVTVDPAVDIPAELGIDDLDGLPLVVERRRYEIQ